MKFRARANAHTWGFPTVTDRVVQTAVRMVIEPIFENRFAKHSYGFRPGRGCKDALRRVEELLKAGRQHVVEVDIKGKDHQRWPNRYFTKLGLFCLLDARETEFASLRNGANH